MLPRAKREEQRRALCQDHKDPDLLDRAQSKGDTQRRTDAAASCGPPGPWAIKLLLLSKGPLFPVSVYCDNLEDGLRDRTKCIHEFSFALIRPSSIRLADAETEFAILVIRDSNHGEDVFTGEMDHATGFLIDGVDLREMWSSVVLQAMIS